MNYAMKVTITQKHHPSSVCPFVHFFPFKIKPAPALLDSDAGDDATKKVIIKRQ